MKKLKIAAFSIFVILLSSGCIKNKYSNVVDTNDSNASDTIDYVEYMDEDSIDQNSMNDSTDIGDLATTEDNDESALNGTEKIYTNVDEMPEFVGGTEAMQRYLKENIKFPQGETEQGRVIVRVVIDKNGNIKDPTVIRKLSPKYDREALRVIKEMPQWIAGIENEKAVSVYYTIPIAFRLN